MTSAIIYICLSLAAGGDSVTLANGKVFTGQVQSVTMKIAGRQREVSRQDIRSLTMAATPGGDSVIVVADKQLSGQLLRVQIKTAAATLTLERDKIQAMTLSGDAAAGAGSAGASGEAAPGGNGESQAYSDKITLKIGHELHAVVAAVQLDDRLYVRSAVESLTLGGDGDTLALAGGKTVSGRLKGLRVRLAVGVVDLDRSDVSAVQLAKASAEAPPPPGRSSEPPTPEQNSALSANGAAKEECVRKVAAAKSDAMSKIAAKYTQPQSELDVDMRVAESEAVRAQERVQTQLNLIDNLRKDLDRNPYNRRASIESRIREARVAANTAADSYRKAVEKLNKAKTRKDKLLSTRKADELTAAKWADAQMTALGRLQSKIGFLILAGVPLESAYVKGAYDAVVTQPPALEELRDDSDSKSKKTDGSGKTSTKKTSRKGGAKDALPPAGGE
ncbi:MAG: hypothetical protein LLG01_08355 [Planctomycetaceae bacterium]|nr:hypothetical protein [Planctomycetaceae bacterium]